MAASTLDFDCPQPFNVNLGEPEAADAIGNTGAVVPVITHSEPHASEPFGNEIVYPVYRGARLVRGMHRVNLAR